MKQILLTLTAIFLIATFSFAQNIPSYVPTNGLVGWWPFNGNANDESGNGNNGTVNGATLTTDRFGNIGKAYSFDGVNDYINCLNAGPTGNPTMTACFWIKSNQNNYGHIIGYGSNASSGQDFRIYINDNCSNGITFDTYDNAKGYSSSVSNNTWDYYCVIYNGNLGNNTNSAKIYKNGEVLSNICISVNISTTNIASIYPITFGRYHGSAQTGFYLGSLDDIAIYNRALTQQEVTQLYNGTNTPCSITNNFITQDTIRVCANNYTIDAGSDFSTYLWSNGAISSSINVSQSGMYKCTVTNSSGCTATDSVYVNLLDAKIANQDTALCKGSSLSLINNLNANSSQNLIMNGDFEQGNLLFSTGYTYCNDLSCLVPLVNNGYSIGNNSNYFHYNFLGIDHTTGNGKFMIVNGGISGLIVWRQKVKVQRSSSYSFDCWISSLVDYNVSKLKFIINGLPLSNDFTAPLNTNEWSQYTSNWNSGNSDTALIEIYNNYEELDGNDFGIDDITFKANNSYAYLWSTGATTSSITVSPEQTTTYYCTIADGISSCRDSVVVTVINDNTSITESACNLYILPWGDSITTSGTYTHTYTNASGCDSTVSAHITINHSVAGASFNASGINTYTLPWGDTATQSGYYTHLYQNEFGCDSLVTAYVVINSPADSSSHNIGINVENPQRNLHIKDAIRLEPRNTPLNNPTKGDIYFDGSLNKLRVYDGTTWQNCW